MNTTPAIPFLTAEQMREVDRLAVEEYGVLLIQMMENAGRNLAALARDRFLEGDPAGRKVVVLAGKGGNGGGGLVCGRRLRGWGARVEVVLSSARGEMGEVPGHQLSILVRLGAPVHADGAGEVLLQADLVVDALVGYSLRGGSSGRTAELIRAANDGESPVLSLDVPSGVDATTGEAHEPSIRATATLTLALPKRGLGEPAGRSHVGELYLADIGVPPELYPESTEGGRLVSILKWPEGAPLNLG